MSATARGIFFSASLLLRDPEVVVAALACAEHGLGRMKTREALQYKDPVAVAAMRAMRAALDPKRIMNPHVLF